MTHFAIVGSSLIPVPIRAGVPIERSVDSTSKFVPTDEDIELPAFVMK